MKKIIILSLIAALVFCMTSCKKKELVCDGCGKTVQVEANSNMTDEWILFCEECGEPEI